MAAPCQIPFQMAQRNSYVVFNYHFLVPLLNAHSVNIHTHLIPFLFWAANLIPIVNDSFAYDTPELLFMAFALLCLLCSAVWHTMSGCAHRNSMEFCARVDYVGIGWWVFVC